MPRFEPFNGLRYNPEMVRLDRVIAPPYDVIESAERVHLANRSPQNSVLIELPEADLVGGLDRYQVAATLLESWLEEGVLTAEGVRALYPYKMTSPDGRSSMGVIGALGLPEPGEESDILPHEQTLPKPKSDRLDLLRATRANLSPIWGLSLTAGLSATFEPEEPPVIDAYDDDRVRHQLWVIDEPEVIDAVCQGVAASPLVIADGHHRYETARAYQAERRQASGDRPADADLVMALVVELADDQLTVGPIHRTISGLPESTDLPGAFSKWFAVVRAGDATERVVGALGQSHSLALITPEGAWMLTPHPEAFEAAGSDLDSSLVELMMNELPAHTSTHRHTWHQAFSSVVSGESQAAVLLRPVTVDQIAEWAAARRKMPPKTTYFSPKPRTGMVFRELED
jgi:uncharacterized protein (DUF1015 family)